MSEQFGLPDPCGKRANVQYVVAYPDGSYGISDPLCQVCCDEMQPNETVSILHITGVHYCIGGSAL